MSPTRKKPPPPSTTTSPTENIRYGLHARKREASAKLHGKKLRPVSPFIPPVAFPEYEADDSYEEMPIEEVFRNDDVFEADDAFALARIIVSSEPSLGERVRRRFREKFTHIDMLPRIQINVGSVAVFTEGNRFIYYLAVKDKEDDRFSYANFVSCLENVRDHVVKQKVKRVALSVCGLKINQMCWPTLRLMVSASFDNIGIEELLVYRGQRERQTKEKQQ